MKSGPFLISGAFMSFWFSLFSTKSTKPMWFDVIRSDQVPRKRETPGLFTLALESLERELLFGYNAWREELEQRVQTRGNVEMPRGMPRVSISHYDFCQSLWWSKEDITTPIKICYPLWMRDTCDSPPRQSAWDPSPLQAPVQLIRRIRRSWRRRTSDTDWHTENGSWSNHSNCGPFDQVSEWWLCSNIFQELGIWGLTLGLRTDFVNGFLRFDQLRNCQIVALYLLVWGESGLLLRETYREFMVLGSCLRRSFLFTSLSHFGPFTTCTWGTVRHVVLVVHVPRQLALYARDALLHHVDLASFPPASSCWALSTIR